VPPVTEYEPTSSPGTRDNAPVKASDPYNEPDVMEYPIAGSSVPKTLNWPAVGVTVIARPVTVGLSDVIEFAYAVEYVGVNVADNAATPKSDGTQSHVAVVVAAVTAPQPEMVVPPNMKFTVPARDVVAVMRLVVWYRAEEASNRLTVVEAYPIATVKFDVDAVAPFASVTVIDTVDEPATVGVPEIVPVEALRLRPLASVPVSA
jgi:hypothetical protein